MKEKIPNDQLTEQKLDDLEEINKRVNSSTQTPLTERLDTLIGDGDKLSEIRSEAEKINTMHQNVREQINQYQIFWMRKVDAIDYLMKRNKVFSLMTQNSVDYSLLYTSIYYEFVNFEKDRAFNEEDWTSLNNLLMLHKQFEEVDEQMRLFLQRQKDFHEQFPEITVINNKALMFQNNDKNYPFTEEDAPFIREYENARKALAQAIKDGDRAGVDYEALYKTLLSAQQSIKKYTDNTDKLDNQVKSIKQLIQSHKISDDSVQKETQRQFRQELQVIHQEALGLYDQLGNLNDTEQAIVDLGNKIDKAIHTYELNSALNGRRKEIDKLKNEYSQVVSLITLELKSDSVNKSGKTILNRMLKDINLNLEVMERQYEAFKETGLDENKPLSEVKSALDLKIKVGCQMLAIQVESGIVEAFIKKIANLLGISVPSWFFGKNKPDSTQLSESSSFISAKLDYFDLKDRIGQFNSVLNVQKEKVKSFVVGNEQFERLELLKQSIDRYCKQADSYQNIELPTREQIKQFILVKENIELLTEKFAETNSLLSDLIIVENTKRSIILKRQDIENVYNIISSCTNTANPLLKELKNTLCEKDGSLKALFDEKNFTNNTEYLLSKAKEVNETHQILRDAIQKYQKSLLSKKQKIDYLVKRDSVFSALTQDRSIDYKFSGEVITHNYGNEVFVEEDMTSLKNLIELSKHFEEVDNQKNLVEESISGFKDQFPELSLNTNGTFSYKGNEYQLPKEDMFVQNYMNLGLKIAVSIKEGDQLGVNYSELYKQLAVEQEALEKYTKSADKLLDQQSKIIKLINGINQKKRINKSDILVQRELNKQFLKDLEVLEFKSADLVSQISNENSTAMDHSIKEYTRELDNCITSYEEKSMQINNIKDLMEQIDTLSQEINLTLTDKVDSTLSGTLQMESDQNYLIKLTDLKIEILDVLNNLSVKDRNFFEESKKLGDKLNNLTSSYENESLSNSSVLEQSDTMDDLIRKTDLKLSVTIDSSLKNTLQGETETFFRKKLSGWLKDARKVKENFSNESIETKQHIDKMHKFDNEYNLVVNQSKKMDKAIQEYQDIIELIDEEKNKLAKLDVDKSVLDKRTDILETLSKCVNTNIVILSKLNTENIKTNLEGQTDAEDTIKELKSVLIQTIREVGSEENLKKFNSKEQGEIKEFIGKIAVQHGLSKELLVNKSNITTQFKEKTVELKESITTPKKTIATSLKEKAMSIKEKLLKQKSKEVEPVNDYLKKP